GLHRRGRPRGQAPQAADVVAAASITEADTEQVLLRLSSWDVVRMGLLSNRGWALAIAAFGVLFQTVPRPVMDDALQRGGREAFGYASHLHPGMVGAFLLLAAALLLGWLAQPEPALQRTFAQRPGLDAPAAHRQRRRWPCAR
ncbi:hypothetical protein ACEN9Z_23210, partial [Stenotrophomonas geniculata]